MQIRLGAKNTKLLQQLQRLYRKACPDYDVSATQQCNLLLSGRLGLAIKEAEAELKKLRRCGRCA